MEGEGRATAIPHIAALDGARGVAVAGVLLFHGGHLLGGYLGVDFFFTLSGFLITSLLLAEASRAGSVGLGGFWARRARRLLPALAVLMIAVAVYAASVVTPTHLGQIRGDAFATLGYVANWHEIFSHQNYFTLFTTPSPLNHTWSLAIEEQFYVIWPLVFVGLLARWKRSAPYAVLITSLVLAAASSVLMFVLYDPNNPTKAGRVYFGTDTRATAILLGAALAAWLAIHGPVTSSRARTTLEVLGGAGALTLAIAWTRLDGQSTTLYRGGFLLCALAATAIIAAAVHPEPGPIARVLSLRPLCALGLISYGVYLYHWPIDVFLDQNRVGFGGWSLFAVQTAVALAVSIASYRFLEQPIRHGALSAVQWRRLTPAIAIGLVVVVFAGTNGARPGRTVVHLRDPLGAATRAYRASPPGARRVMIVGDSVGYFLGESMKAIATTPPLAVFNASIEGCAFPPQVVAVRYPVRVFRANVVGPASSCDPDWEAGAIERFRPSVVIWIVNGPAGSVLYRGKWVKTCSNEFASLYRESLTKELATLGSRGATVAITTEAYPRYLGADVDRPTDCENRIRRAVAAATRTTIIDLAAYICPHGRCRDQQDGAVLRPDGQHYEGAGGRIVARWLIDEINARPPPNRRELSAHSALNSRRFGGGGGAAETLRRDGDADGREHDERGFGDRAEADRAVRVDRGDEHDDEG